eukprot:5758680-Alexandrium_andersonii.AAC.1
MKACHAAWNELVATVGSDFISHVIGEEAERLTSEPAKIPPGTWVADPEGRRVQDVVCVHRSMRTSGSA